MIFKIILGSIVCLKNPIHALTGTKIIQHSTTTKENYDTIVFSGDTIIDIGKKREVESKYSFDTYEELPDTIIMPGLVNTHTHSIQAFFRGIAENLQLLDWLNTVILPGEASLKSGDEVYASSLLGFIDMVSNGTTFSNDMITTHHSENALQAAIDIGIRVKTGKLLMDTGSWLADETSVAIEETYHLIENYHHKYPLLEYSINPRFLVSSSPELMKFCGQILKEDPSLSFHTHASENRSEVELVNSLHGKYIHSLHEYGVLGNRSILAHGIWLDSSDVEILSKTNTSIAHCPSSNAKLASGICNWPHLEDNNIFVGLGTDGSPSNNTMDMFREMRLATFLQRVQSLDETKAPSHKVFDLATIKGAKALARNDLGTLEIGKKADFVVVDTSHPSNFPIHDFINHLVFKASGRDVLRNYVGGKMIYNKNTTTYDKMFPLIPSGKLKNSLKIAEKFVETKSWVLNCLITIFDMY